MEVDKENRIKEVAAKLIKKNIKKNLNKEAVDKLKDRALNKIGLEEDTMNKIGASLAVGKALVDKKINMPISKNLKLRLNANKNKEGIALFYNKRF